jgi:hypothetical protein
MNKHIIALAVLLLLPVVCVAQEIVVLEGTPIIQNKSSVNESGNFPLTESQQNESRLIITKKGQKYYWTSRQYRELTKYESGAYTIFLENKGAGYVKTMKNEDKVFYMEHMGIGLETITYWGTADYLRP